MSHQKKSTEAQPKPTPVPVKETQNTFVNFVPMSDQYFRYSELLGEASHSDTPVLETHHYMPMGKKDSASVTVKKTKSTPEQVVEVTYDGKKSNIFWIDNDQLGTVQTTNPELAKAWIGAVTRTHQDHYLSADKENDEANPLIALVQLTVTSVKKGISPAEENALIVAANKIGVSKERQK